MSAPLRSRLPPNCGLVSSTTLAISELEPEPARKVLLVIFLIPPPEVSRAMITSSLAAVLISVKSPIVLLLTSRMFNSAAVDVTPSTILSSAVVAVTPAIKLSSVVVAVTPSKRLSSAAVDEIAVPLKLIASR